MAKKLKFHSRRKPQERVGLYDMIATVAADTGFNKNDIEEVVKAMLKQMRETVIDQKLLYLEGIGGVFAFLTQERNLKSPQSKSTKDRVVVPACFRPRFQASKDLKDTLKRKFVSQTDIDNLYE